MTTTSTKGSLLDILDSTARRWEEEAGRNLAAAGALVALARYITSLGVNDPRLRTLEELVPLRDGEIQFRPQVGVSSYLASLSQAVTLTPPPAALDGLISAAAADFVDWVRDDLGATTDQVEGSPLQRIARIAQRKSELDSDLDQLLRAAAARGVPLTVLADLSAVPSQTLASLYGTQATETSDQAERPPSKSNGAPENPTCGDCNHPRSFHRGEKCFVGPCECSGFLGAASSRASGV